MSCILRAGFEGSGSPRWLMRTIQRRGFDTARGFCLELSLLKDSSRRHGTLRAVADGEADVVAGDWLALAEAREQGLPITAVLPYGQILGTLMLRRGLAGGDLSALCGRRLGVLSTGDKNWNILRAACRLRANFALEQAVRIAPHSSRAALDEALESGTVDAALVHWHRVPELLAGGHRVLAEMPDLAGAISPASAPTTFFVVHEEFASRQPERVAAFIDAVREGIAVMRREDAPWIDLAKEVGSGIAALAPLPALRERWNSRVADVLPWSPDSRRSLAILRGHLLDVGAPPSPRGMTVLPEGAFDARFLP